MTIVGTRPEIIKMSEIIKKCDMYFDHIIVHTGQNYDKNLNDIFWSDFDTCWDTKNFLFREFPSWSFI